MWAAGGHHVWGAGGQRLVGEILEDVVLPHQNQDPRQLAGQSSFLLFCHRFLVFAITFSRSFALLFRAYHCRSLTLSGLHS